MADSGQDVGRLGRLIELLHERGLGIYILPVAEGERLGGFGSDYRVAFDGWLIGTMTNSGGDELAVGPTLPEAVEAALRVWLDV